MRLPLLALCALMSKRVFGVGRFALLAVVLVPAMASQAEAAAPPQYVRAACHDDAKRLCASVLSNTAKRQACMKEHHADLSAGCKAAVAKWHGKEGGQPTSSDDSTKE
jgi:hypothetical protein